MSERLTHPQKRALACLKANWGEASEDTLWTEGLNLPRLTMYGLERRGLVVRGEHLDENQGYLWKLAAVSEDASGE